MAPRPRPSASPVPALPPALQAGSPGSVEATLLLLNNSLIPGNLRAASLLAPNAVAMDTRRHLAYVVGQTYGPGALAVVNLSTGTTVKTIALAAPPPGGSVSSSSGIAYDAASDRVYISDGYNGAVDVVDAATQVLISTIAIGRNTFPVGMAYDNATNRLFVADDGSAQVTVIDAGTDAVVTNVSVGTSPSRIAFDASTGDLYVTNAGSDNVSVIGGATDRLVASVELGVPVQGIAYDAARHAVVVTRPTTANLSVIDETTNRVVQNLSMGKGAYPYGIAYDAATGKLYVSNLSFSGFGLGTSGSVIVVDGTTGAVLRRVAVGAAPGWPVADSGSPSGDVLVPNLYSENVTVIRGTTDRTVANLTVGTGPEWFSVDPASGRMYVTNGYGHSLLAIDPATRRVAQETFLGSQALPAGVAYDSSNGNVYVADHAAGDVIVVNATSGAVLSRIALEGSASLEGVAYDPANNRLYVAASGLNVVFVVDAAANRVVGPVTVGGSPLSLVVDPANANLFVTNSGSGNVSVVSTFTDRVVTSIHIGIGASPSSIAYDSANGHVFVTVSNRALVTDINATTNRVAANISLGAGAVPSGIAYSPATGDVYVADGIANNVSAIDPTQDAVLGSMDVGYDPFGVLASPTAVCVSNLGSGTVSFIGSRPELVFHVTFSESGLPLGTSWSVTLGGDTNTSSTNETGFGKPNGTYAFTVSAVAGYNAVPGSGLVVVNGSDLVRPIAFSPIPRSHTVTFTEAGLPPGSIWTVTLNATTHGSTTATVTFSVFDGAYAFVVGSVPGYSALPRNGSVTVSGVDVSQAVAFTAVTYAVTFQESGLPSGTSWSVTLAATTKSSTSALLSFTEANGTYSFTVGNTTGYISSPGSGSIAVNGGDVSRSIAFAAVSSAPVITAFTVMSSPIRLGSSVTFSVTASGGSGTLSYAYQGLPTGCSSANAATITCVPTQTGTFTVTVVVTDTLGHGATATASLVVTGGANTLLGLPLSTAIALLGAMALVVLVVTFVILLWLRNRRTQPPDTKEPPQPPRP